ncbi:unnamed protein product [Phytophthora lilii]|uniref:Unnamed protein product n=1 Tax=Phytophthora lilii TaxID=2077276 RepID=A0A9W6WNH1_9STRA|nr:unnamed protein product [Phytophthora lilii]
MHARMRRQSLKQTEIREAREVEADCVTLDLGSACSRDSWLVQEQPSDPFAGEKHWVPHSIEELRSSSSSEGCGGNFSPGKMDDSRLEDELVLKVLQPLTQDAKFRLEGLGGLDLAVAVPAFVYRVFLADEENGYSGDATEGSPGVYRIPRLLHNSRVNLPPRPAHYYL